ncbi:unnamed protein product [Symbiodinium sp. CCMP2592]|nr:unnamed protein product [Symbiodinium sp. CCMP2592]
MQKQAPCCRTDVPKSFEAISRGLQSLQETDQVADASRALSTENENLRQELVQSKQATTEAETRLQEVTLQLHQFGQAITQFQSQYQADAATIQRLQGDLASTQETGASQAGQLELALRERNEANQRLQEVLQRSQETSQVAHAGSTENERLRQELAQSREELMRCVAKLQDAERLQLEIRRLLPFEEASKELETRLKEAELQLEQRSQAMTELQRQHAADAASIQRLQGDLLSIQETGESQAGQLESALLERNKECATLRRERNEAQQKLQEVLQRNQENLQVADAGRALSTENEAWLLRWAEWKQELKSLNSVVERCVAKMEAESRERPFLVDKRMVTQMLAAYLEQRENPGEEVQALERHPAILNKMADLLGFTSAEREQVGLSQKRKTPLQMQEPQGLADLTDRFVDFLMEESVGPPTDSETFAQVCQGMKPREDSSRRTSGDVAGVRPSSITGIRNAMLAVLREAALQTVSEILLERRRHHIRGALSCWHQNARRRQLQREHDRAVVVAAGSTERLRKQHADEDALTRQRWKQEREVLIKQIGEEPSEEDVRRLLQLDSQHRSNMSVLGDRQQRAHQEHDFAHAQVQKGHKKNLKVMAFAALEAMVKASPEKRPGDVRLSEGSPSVCFLQWAFTEHPEVWSVPFPPAADLMHAMAQTEQRVSLASALSELRSAGRRVTAISRPGSLSGAAEKPWGKEATAVRFLRRALTTAVRRSVGSFFGHLKVSPPASPKRSRGRSTLAGTAAPATAGALRHRVASAFHLGEEFHDSRRAVPEMAAGSPLAARMKALKADAAKQAQPPQAVARAPTDLQHAAATKIQAHARGRWVRKRVRKKATKPEESHLPPLPPPPWEVQQAAATKIQAHVRGKQGRARASKLRKKTFTRRSALKLQMRAADEESPTPGLHRQPSKAAPVPPAKRRPSAGAKRPDDALQEPGEFEQSKALPSRLPAIPPEVAATKIQAAVRGHQARRRVAHSRPRKARILSASRSQLTDAEESEEDEEEEEEEDGEEEDEEDDEEDGGSVAVLGPPVGETE